MNSARIASSSSPMFSMSSAERWSMGLVGFFCRTVMVTPSGGLCGVGVQVVDRAGAGGGVDAGLDLDAVALGGGGDLAGAEVTHGALAHREDAAVADAHAAPARHEYAGLLGLVEDPSVAGGL